MALLTLLLFLPWFGLIGGLFCAFPRHPRTPRRRLVDAAFVCLALSASIGAMLWGYATGQQMAGSGPIWPQVVAVLYAYGSFLATIALALMLRPVLWRTLRMD